MKASAVMSRKQFPVLIDFVGERIYAETTDAEEIGALRHLLQSLGAEPISIAWNFGNPDWPSKFLNKVREANNFGKEMADRAEELRRFRGMRSRNLKTR